LRRILFPLAFVLLWTVCLDRPTSGSLAYHRPQDTIASYWHRMIEGRHLQALDCFANASPEGVRQMISLPNMVELRCRDFSITDQGRGTVDVAYTVEYRVKMGNSLAQFRTGDRLILTQRGWKIAAPIVVARHDSTRGS
jgi:hypothetical protein